MKLIRYILLASFIGCLSMGLVQPATAQKTLIDIKLDSAAILIGEQRLIELAVTTDKDKSVRLVLPIDTIMRGVEVLDISKPDTVKIENDRQIIKQNVLITSFDSALYLLPPFLVIDGADTIRSQRVALKVSSVPVDVDHPEEFFDIKTAWKPPFVFADYYPIIFGIIGAILLILLGIYIYKRLKKKQSLIPLVKEKLKLSPYAQAIKELDEIRQQKLWQQGRNKEYYTSLTDVIRKYIENRFEIGAMEMTSDQILHLIQMENDAESVHSNLSQILELSDFVKFAKLHPLPDENELSLMNAYLFVNQTKPVEVIKPQVTEGETEAGEKAPTAEVEEEKSTNEMNKKDE